jgi:hypothetical protein
MGEMHIAHGGRASLAYQASLAEEKVRRHAMAAANRRDRLAWLKTLIDDPQLLLRRPIPPTSRLRDQFNALIIIRQTILEDILEPFCLRQVPVETGGSSKRTSPTETDRSLPLTSMHFPRPKR